MTETTIATAEAAIGIDLGDKHSRWCLVGASSAVEDRGSVATTEPALSKAFGSRSRMRIAIETGTHSPWVSRLLISLGHEVIVANARKLRLIHMSESKNDWLDAERLARLARVDPKLLAPIQHRGPTAQAQLSALRARDALVRARTLLINNVRGSVKSVGGRIPSCSAESFPKQAAQHLPMSLAPCMGEMLLTITELNLHIRRFDKDIERVAAKDREAQTLMQVAGVGPLTALVYILTLESPDRFQRSRQVGAYLGLRPRQADSGDLKPQLRITKTGDTHLRRLLVGSAQYILGPFGPDTDLRRFGLKLAERGGKNAKKRAIVAVARKLAVLLHSLWKDGTTYEPLRADHAAAMAAASGKRGRRAKMS